jgi:diguanylate cyclase (GGDEF)-like protein
VYGIVRAASLLAAVALAAAFGPDAFRSLDPDRARFALGALVVAIALGLLRAPTAHFERSTRPTPESDRVGLIAPVLLSVLVVDGWFFAAACNVAAYLCHAPRRRGEALRERILGAALRVPAWFVAGSIAPTLRSAVEAVPALQPVLWFALVASAYVLLVDLLWIDPLFALRQSRALLRVWIRHFADRGTMLTAVIEAAWAYVIARTALHDGPFLGLAMFAPLIVLAVTLVRLARLNARLHRLSLSREAVDAMLRASDPQPQMRSLLESVNPRIVREAVEIDAFGRAGTDRWSRIVRFGPPVPAELEHLGGRVLLEIQVTGDDHTTEIHDDGTVTAFAARDGEGRLRGALVVYRALGSPVQVAERELSRAANEIGPLLGEYGAIAATRSAASVDTLTSLPNRRGVTRALEDAMERVRGGGACAVLLLDVDHFKSINDLLGHQSGDRALAQIGRIIADNIRGADVAGRFGGEEFLVLLRDAGRERALQVAERLRAAIQSGGLAYADGKPVTTSIGVAYAAPADGPHDVIERADRALYRAKNAGRNCVMESPLVAV